MSTPLNIPADTTLANTPVTPTIESVIRGYNIALKVAPNIAKLHPSVVAFYESHLDMITAALIAWYISSPDASVESEPKPTDFVIYVEDRDVFPSAPSWLGADNLHRESGGACSKSYNLLNDVHPYRREGGDTHVTVYNYLQEKRYLTDHLDPMDLLTIQGKGFPVFRQLCQLYNCKRMFALKTVAKRDGKTWGMCLRKSEGADEVEACWCSLDEKVHPGDVYLHFALMTPRPPKASVYGVCIFTPPR